MTKRETNQYEFKNKDELDKILNAISDTYRIRTLFLLNDGLEVKNIARIIGRTESGVYKYLDKFRIAGLIISGGKELTNRGRKICTELRDFSVRSDTLLTEILKEEFDKLLNTNAKMYQTQFGSAMTREKLLKIAKKIK